MKAITVKQPFAFLIVGGVKDIENRTRQTKFRGRVLVHASAKPSISISMFECLTKEQRWQAFEVLSIEDYQHNLKTSAIIGSVEIVDCVVNHPSIWAEKTHGYKPGVNLKLMEKIYGTPTIYNWVLANPIMFPEPIPAKGKLSFWESGIELCHICGKPTDKDSLCERCDKYYCEKCSAKYNQFTQIDFNCCESCSI